MWLTREAGDKHEDRMPEGIYELVPTNLHVTKYSAYLCFKVVGDGVKDGARLLIPIPTGTALVTD